ncbi:hypothetical protein [Rhodococcus gannanensis]|uniref:Glycine zipper family protein n=1 Tax=Rhodococcus gannanensis TaxID=1960308 RepID=A0ABW4PAC5_9NOCA
MAKTLVMPALVVATIVVGTGTASAQLPAPPPLPELPALPPLPSIQLPELPPLPQPAPVQLPAVELPSVQLPAVTVPEPIPLPTVTLPDPSPVDLPALPPPPQVPTLDEVARMLGLPPPPTDPPAVLFANQVWPNNESKREAFVDLSNEVVVGWNNGGQQRMMLGSFVGLAIGCVSIFPNFLAGCMLGNLIGAGVGAVTGIDEGNPKARPSLEKFMATPW